MMEYWVFYKDIIHFNFIFPPLADHSPNTPVSQNPFSQYSIFPTFQLGKAPNLLIWQLGTIMCPELQEDVIFGQYMDPRAGQENFAVFKKARGYEKCALPPGVGARLAAEVILAGNDQKQ